MENLETVALVVYHQSYSCGLLVNAYGITLLGLEVVVTVKYDSVET